MALKDLLGRMMGASSSPALVEATGSYVDAVDGDEDLWSPIKGGRRRDLNPIDQRRARRISLYLWRRNPVAHRLIEQMADFVVGDGFTISADSDQAERIAKEIWNDPVMALAMRHRDIVRDLGLFGELAVKAAVNPIAGRMRLGFLDVERIKEVDLDPRTS